MTAYRGADYWVGNLATTVAIAATTPDPRPVLRSALREFLRERPAGDPLGDMIRAELKGKP
jgi:hypothetical protein